MSVCVPAELVIPVGGLSPERFGHRSEPYLPSVILRAHGERAEGRGPQGSSCSVRARQLDPVGMSSLHRFWIATIVEHLGASLEGPMAASGRAVGGSASRGLTASPVVSARWWAAGSVDPGGAGLVCLILGLLLIVGDDQNLRFEHPDGERPFSVDLVGGT